MLRVFSTTIHKLIYLMRLNICRLASFPPIQYVERMQSFWQFYLHFTFHLIKSNFKAIKSPFVCGRARAQSFNDARCEGSKKQAMQRRLYSWDKFQFKFKPIIFIQFCFWKRTFFQVIVGYSAIHILLAKHILLVRTSKMVL